MPAFDGGRLTSDGGVTPRFRWLSVDLGMAERLARCFPDRRDPPRITHTLADTGSRPHPGDCLRI